MECHRIESQSMCPSQPFKEPLGAHIIDTIRIFMLIHIVCVNFIARQGAGRRRTQHDIRGVQKMEETQCRYTNEVVRASNLRRVDSGRQQHFARSARHPSHQRCLGCRVACILRQSAATKNEPEEKAGDGRGSPIQKIEVKQTSLTAPPPGPVRRHGYTSIGPGGGEKRLILSIWPVGSPRAMVDQRCRNIDPQITDLQL